MRSAPRRHGRPLPLRSTRLVDIVEQRPQSTGGGRVRVPTALEHQLVVRSMGGSDLARQIQEWVLANYKRTNVGGTTLYDLTT